MGQVGARGSPVQAPPTHHGAVPDGTNENIDPANAQVQERHAQELVVEGRRTNRPEQRVETEDAQSVEDAEDGLAERCPGRRRRVGDEQMQTKKHRGRNLRIDEIRDPGYRRVQRARSKQHDGRETGDERDRKVVHDDQADQKQHEVDPRREDQRRRDLRPPGQLGGVGGDEHERKGHQRERRRVEDVRQPAITVPPDEFLAQESDRDHQELEVEPIVLEPQEQIDAEDDRHRSEAEDIAVATRPGQQHVEGVGKSQLGHHEPGHVVDRPPVPAPVGEQDHLKRGLQVMLQAQHRAKRPAGRRALQPQEEHNLPDQQHRRRRPERPG